MVNGMQSQNDRLHEFKLKICSLIHEETHRSRSIRVAPGALVYVSGDRDAKVYCIESGQIKLSLYTPEGREYVLAMRNSRDLFGELCLSGEFTRTETAMAVQDTRLKAMHYRDLLTLLKGESLLEDFIQFLACCNAEQQKTIGSLLIENSEQRLAKVLLRLGAPFDADCARGRTTVARILHEDLAAMVGTTRSRIGLFLKRFRDLGLIEVNADRSLTLKTEMLHEFAGKRTFEENAKMDANKNSLQHSLQHVHQLGGD
jgi:CRP/FNR family transcriptional regulator, cyclic AMP receptor protein